MVGSRATMARNSILTALLLALGFPASQASAAVVTPGDTYRVEFTTSPAAWTTIEGCAFAHGGPPPCPPDTLSLTFFGDSVFLDVMAIDLAFFYGDTLVGSGHFEGDFNVSPRIALTTESSPLTGLPFLSRVSDELWQTSVLLGCAACRAEFRVLSGMMVLDEPSLEFAISRAELHGGGTFWVDGWFTVTDQRVIPEPSMAALFLTATMLIVERQRRRFKFRARRT
jgi:hypothetical protein